MRDLQKDLEICEQLLKTPCALDDIEKVINKFFMVAREGWPEAIHRAIAAESQVKLLWECYLKRVEELNAQVKKLLDSEVNKIIKEGRSRNADDD